MKAPLGFLALGLGVGTAAGWMMWGNSSSEVTPVAAATKSDRPALGSSGAVAAAEDKLPTKRERPAASDKAGEPTVMSFSSASGMTPEMKDMMAKVQSKMEERRKEARKRKIEERLAALKARLNLTPDQEAKARALLGKSPDMGQGFGPSITSFTTSDGNAGGISALEATLSGGKPTGPSFDEELGAILSPEQKDDFAAFQQEQRDNRTEIATNREMNQLQQQLTLTPEQKDQVFQVLGDVVRNEQSQEGNHFDLPAMRKRKQDRLDALRPILTPEQMKAYEGLPALPFGGPEVMIMPGGDAIETYQIDVEDSE